jgi:hypothetical protein
MGESTELCNDILVGHRVTGEAGELRVTHFICQRFKQRHTLILCGKLFAVLKGQVQEYPVNGGEAKMTATRDGVLGQNKGQWIARKGLRLAPVDIARELVKQHHKSDQAPVCLRPGIQLSLHSLGKRRAKLYAARLIRFIVGAKPQPIMVGSAKPVFIQFAEPEIVDIFAVVCQG